MSKVFLKFTRCSYLSCAVASSKPFQFKSSWFRFWADLVVSVSGMKGNRKECRQNEKPTLETVFENLEAAVKPCFPRFQGLGDSLLPNVPVLCVGGMASPLPFLCFHRMGGGELLGPTFPGSLLFCRVGLILHVPKVTPCPAPPPSL